MAAGRRITIYLDDAHAEMLDDARKMAPDLPISQVFCRLIEAGLPHFGSAVRLDLIHRAEILEAEAKELRMRGGNPRYVKVDK